MASQLSLFDPEPARPGGAVRRGTVRIAGGARAAEDVLLAHLDALLAESAADPRLLAEPVRVVVPSRSLRAHLSAALLARRGRAAAGLLVQTLRSLALEVLERAGEPAPRGAALFDLLAQRYAREEPALSRGLDGFADGYATVAVSVRDLLDAGLERPHAEAAREALAAEGTRVAPRAAVERARALVRVAARVEAAASRFGIGRASHLFRRAVDLLADDPGRALPARAVLIHGFADATGLATDLLAALLLRPGALLILDRPPDPARSAAAGTGDGTREETKSRTEAAFTERLAGRLAFAVRLEGPTGPPAPAPRLTLVEAPGPEAEARALAGRLAGLIEAGARPEGIAVVARDLSPYRLALRRHCERLGVPFSGLAARGSVEPAGRRAAALLDLLRRGEETPCDRWLDAALSLPAPEGSAGGAGRARLYAGGRRLVDLRLACRALGAGRLRDLAALDPARLPARGDRYPLPIRHGLRDDAAPDGEAAADAEGEGEERPGAAVRAPRRTVALADVERAVRAARALARRFFGWPREAPAGAQLAELRGLLAADLGWEKGQAEVHPLLTALDALAREVPRGFSLALDELRLLVARALDGIGISELGGAGGGVQVLSAMEARGRTCEHLFVIGLARDAFPRTVREDPLLPDALRLVLCGPAGDGVLPDLTLKSRGFEEERYLFAQLLSSAPEVTLSWPAADDEGRPLPRSPLLDRLPAGGGEPDRVPPPWALPVAGDGPRPALERAVLAALHGPRAGLAAPLAAALAESRAALLGPGAGGPDPGRLAAARLAVLDELDPDRRTPEGRAAALTLGPYFGFLGPVAAGADPRRRDLWVTHLEGFAACPWQTLLRRLLRIEPTHDPLAGLPGLDAALVGNVVHAVLERLVRERAGWAEPEEHETRAVRPTSAWDAGAAVPVSWPPPADLDRLLAAEAARAVMEEGIALPGLARALAERCRPLLEAARRDWEEAGGALPVIAVEAAGVVVVEDAAGAPRPVLFKADRVDLAPDGALRLTDYKTGKPFSEASREDTRRRHLLARLRAGVSLQAAAYLLSAGTSPGGPAARGRYLFLRPDLAEEGGRELALEAGDAEAAAAFAGAVRTAVAAWEAGTFFPRVVDPEGRKEPLRCASCEVAEACLRGDSGSRRRLLEGCARAASAEEAEAAAGPAAAVLLAAWRLAARAGNGEEGAAGEGSAQGAGMEPGEDAGVEPAGGAGLEAARPSGAAPAERSKPGGAAGEPPAGRTRLKLVRKIGTAPAVPVPVEGEVPGSGTGLKLVRETSAAPAGRSAPEPEEGPSGDPPARRPPGEGGS